jgi:23S rRNA (uracil1939-C5)-methyltransferase
VVDLYCGIGGLGRTLLAAAHHTGKRLRLVGIESSASAVADAEHSARAAGLDPKEARFLCGDVEDLVQEVLYKPAVVLLNPPRRGCVPGVLDALATCAPRAIAYLSCSPQSLARDLHRLLAAGYRVTQVTPYDMHPGTPHIETLVLLRLGAD